MTREELEKLSVGDVLHGETYKKRLTQMLEADFAKAKKCGHRTFMHRLKENGIEDAEVFVSVFEAILSKQCALPAYLRHGIQVYAMGVFSIIMREWIAETKKNEFEAIRDKEADNVPQA